MNAADRKAWARARRERAKQDGSLTRYRSVRFTDRRKEAARKACRGKVQS